MQDHRRQLTRTTLIFLVVVSFIPAVTRADWAVTAFDRQAGATGAIEYRHYSLGERTSGSKAEVQLALFSTQSATLRMIDQPNLDRRLAEISEKYRHQHVLRPYRLHLVDVPVWRLATDVRRGERRWPVVFDFLPLLGTVAPTRCPTCDAHSPLVATKTHLGCDTCVPAKTPPVRPAPAAEKPQRARNAPPAKAGAGPAPVPKRQPCDDTPVMDRKRPDAPRAPAAPSTGRPGAPARPGAALGGAAVEAARTSRGVRRPRGRPLAGLRAE